MNNFKNGTKIWLGLAVLLFAYPSHAADVAIGDLDAVTSLSAANTIITEVGGVAKRITLTNFGATLPTLNQNTSGNAGTATALAADGANCSAGSAPLGVDVSGAAQGCFAVATAANWGGSAAAPPAIGGTTPAAGTFTTLTTATTATPSVIFNDSDSAGADKETAKILVNSETVTDGSEDGKMSLQVMVDGTEATYIALDGNLKTAVITPDTTITGDLTVSGNDIHLGATNGVKLTSDGDGAITLLGESGGYDESITFNLDDTDNEVTVTSSGTQINFSALNLVTTGYVQGGIKIVTDADGMSAAEMTTGGMYGTLFLATGSGTWILPTAVEGMSICLRDTGTAHDLILDVQAGDDMQLLGVEDTNGDGITNAAGSTTGDFVCVIATSAGHWMTMGMGGAWVAQ